MSLWTVRKQAVDILRFLEDGLDVLMIQHLMNDGVHGMSTARDVIHFQLFYCCDHVGRAIRCDCCHLRGTDGILCHDVFQSIRDIFRCVGTVKFATGQRHVAQLPISVHERARQADELALVVRSSTIRRQRHNLCRSKSFTNDVFSPRVKGWNATNR